MQPLFWPLDQLPGLSPEDCQRLAQLDIHTTADLLHRGRQPAKFNHLIRELKLPLRYLRKWLALSDLARVPPVGCRYNGLLLHAGIASVDQLAQASPGRLYGQIRRLHVATLTRSDLCPPPDEIALWIQSARQLANQQPSKRL